MMNHYCLSEISLFCRLNQAGLQQSYQSTGIDESQSVKKSIMTCTTVAGEEVMFDADHFARLVFPVPHRMIFISHLSRDAERVKQIVQVIKVKCPGVRCFVDSEYWENVYNAIEMLQSEYARVEGKDGSYWHHKCSEISKHMYLTLAKSLVEAIKNSPLFIFVPPKDDISQLDANRIRTESPWLALELLTSSLLVEPELEKNAAYNAARMVNESLNIFHAADIGHLHQLTLPEVVQLIRQYI
ncbi:MAG: hypothetical protein UHK44_07255 [Bacteroidaceae bacterium]|nr:hypothetical protein [Bacteroidaceae bacterium]